MARRVIEVGERLNENVALQLAADLALDGGEEDVALDFRSTRHFEPFGMLLVGSAVRRLRRRLERAGCGLEIDLRGVSGDEIAGHMGFWQSMGVAVGRAVNADAGRESYLPITRIGVDELYAEAGAVNPVASGVVERRAAQLAGVLSGGGPAELAEALTYALRELIRNVLEHARTPAVWVAGMSWPKRNFVQVAVLDEGIGIRQSLASNERFRFDNDLEAIRAALCKGVSRNLGRVAGRETLERWEEEGHDRPAAFYGNSGYGLHMIAGVCREAGQFLIASGSASLAQVGTGGEVQATTGHMGTALRLVLHPTEVPAAWNGLFEGIGAKGAGVELLMASTLRRLGLETLTGGGGL